MFTPSKSPNGRDAALRRLIESPAPTPTPIRLPDLRTGLSPQSVLALQRSAGNAHVARMLAPTRPMLQRRNDWALGPVENKKKQLDQTSDWGRGALHHHISRDTLNSMAFEVERL